MTVKLDERDAARLAGEEGPSVALAMRVVTRAAEAMEAEKLLDVVGAHIDSCLYLGPAVLDFADRLADGGAQVTVPTTLNVSSLDLIHPELYRGDPETAGLARRLMKRFEEMGCQPTWTCAPYQLEMRPAFGDHVAWAESNAIVFANSVLGARTHRYGDFIDICCAITGRAPAAGLHLDDNRHATVVVELAGVSDGLLNRDVLYPVLGGLLGPLVGKAVPVITGLPVGVGEDRLKALGAAAATTGSVGLFHVVGSTPEAPTLEVALGGRSPDAEFRIGPEHLRLARDHLSTTSDDRLRTVSLGTPHYSVAEFGHLLEVLGDRQVHPGVVVYASTGRDIFSEIRLRGWADRLAGAGIQVVTDTCTYITPIIEDTVGTTMTDSAKWAYYAPGNLGVEVVFGSTEDCVESAVIGRVVRDEEIWTRG
ncbi:MAG: aconitase X catalytic domain-containing protein [Acidimicrobiales bacterium]|nr:aconitase X catalytic domain-containing protein [Acidimicrobiales bacterium]